ncbi:MAG: sulfur oxidation c-type cytochrome SoxA [Caulobacterales bacterium]|nr:sulfur oxidation c-type cytochrome SoxA [Caulobacterales bacterium]
MLLGACGEPAAAPTRADLDPAEARSGYVFMTADTQALQDDDFANPGFLWVDRGAELFTARTENGPACADCHSESEDGVAGAAARYPALDARSKTLVNLEGRINLCRDRHQDAPALAYESEDLLALTAYVAHLSRGQPLAVEIGEETRAYYATGREYFYRRRGRLDLACHQCHDLNWGKRLRGDTISQGHGNGFPAYRLEWQSLGSLHRRFHDCDAGVRAEPRALGSPDYVALELYLAARASGLAIETPAVRR